MLPNWLARLYGLVHPEIASIVPGLGKFVEASSEKATRLLVMAGHPLSYADFLPPTHAVIALNKIFTLGASFKDVAFELGMLAVLTGLYFSAAVWLFQRTQMKR